MAAKVGSNESKEQVTHLGVDAVKIALGNNSFNRITVIAQSDLGFHPESVLKVAYSTITPQISPTRMAASEVRGPDFIAVRFAPTNQHDLDHAKVWFVFKDTLIKAEVTAIVNLIEGSAITMGGVTYKKI